jgi:hypothetical protein
VLVRASRNFVSSQLGNGCSAAIHKDWVGLEGINVKSALVACLAALTLCSGCILDDEFWEDGYDSAYGSPSGDDDYDSDCSC